MSRPRCQAKFEVGDVVLQCQRVRGRQHDRHPDRWVDEPHLHEHHIGGGPSSWERCPKVTWLDSHVGAVGDPAHAPPSLFDVEVPNV